MAGLTAAYRLQIDQPQLKVTLLEANDYPGGKILTTDFGGEAGGELATSYYTAFINLAKEVGVPINTATFENISKIIYYWSPTREWVKQKDWATWKNNPLPPELRNISPFMLFPYLAKKLPRPDLNQLFNNPITAEFSKQSLLELLETHSIPKVTFPFIETYVEINVDISKISAFSSLIKLWQTPAQFDSIFYYLPEGCQSLPKKLAEKVEDVHYNQKVSKVEKTDKNTYKITTEQGKNYEADYVIFAVPKEPMSQITLNPGLESIQQKAFDSLCYGPSIKIFYKVSSPFWETDGLPLTMWTDTDISFVSPVYDKETRESPFKGSKIWGLCIISAGRNASRIYSKEEQGIPMHQYCQSILEQIRPATRGCLEHVKTYDWGHFPNVLGSFPYYPPDANIPNYYKHIAKPSMGRYFAGEHTECMYKGLNAAVESGLRAARELSHDLKKL